MHHWTVHGKVDFPKFPADVSFAGVQLTTFDPELRNEVKNFSNLGRGGGTFHNCLILNSEMKDLH